MFTLVKCSCNLAFLNATWINTLDSTLSACEEIYVHIGTQTSKLVLTSVVYKHQIRKPDICVRERKCIFRKDFQGDSIEAIEKTDNEIERLGSDIGIMYVCKDIS